MFTQIALSRYLAALLLLFSVAQAQFDIQSKTMSYDRYGRPVVPTMDLNSDVIQHFPTGVANSTGG
jgi:hypothetical protein